MQRELVFTLFGYFFLAATLSIAKFIGGGLGYAIAFPSLIIGMMWVMHFLLRLHKPINKLITHSNLDQAAST